MNTGNGDLELIFKNIIQMLKCRNVNVDRFLNKNKKRKNGYNSL